MEAAHARAHIEVTPSCCTMHELYARGFTSQRLDIAMAIGVRVPDAVRPPGGVPGRINERWFKADVVAMTCCYSAHTGNEVSSRVGGVAERP